MKVVITPSFPPSFDSAEMLRINDVLVNLKEQRLVNPTMSISEFKQVCFERGLNEYLKDLRVFDC